MVKEVRTPAQTTVTGPNPVFTTLYTYDTWNRIQHLTYPDGEVVSFNYDSGGLIKAISGQKQALSYPYLNFIGYDKFEAREQVALGNGTATSYAYNPLNRRLTGLLAKTKSARTFMNMSYGYDAVGNILSLGNSAAIPAGTALYGGTTAYSFGYDNLYELTSAAGAFTKPNVPVQKYTLAMSYDGIHNITHKTQTAFNLLSNGSKTPNVPLTYDWAYAYGGSLPHAATQVGDHLFQYDLDGNQAGWTATDSKQNRVIVWDEDNRMQSVTDSSAQPTTFKYDDDTNRVVKKGAGGETLYINPWYVAALGRNSKQIFAGTTRIVTKLEQFPSGEGYGTGAKNLTEVYQYFYHPDHLGSTGFATDATGEVYQHLEYFPFGETWVDEVSDDTRVPYRFTGQELDEETKLYYFGARYYDPRTSAWENPDPVLAKYLGAGKAKQITPALATNWRSHLTGTGMGGAFNPQNLGMYTYVGNNPLNAVDTSGTDAILLSYPQYRVEWKGLHLPLGHAGVVAVNPTDGSATYYEFGLYEHSKYGMVKSQAFPANTISYDKSGNMITSSVGSLLQKLSASSGQGSDIIYQINRTDYKAVSAYAENQRADVMSDAPKNPYSIGSNNCFGFGTEAFNQGPDITIRGGGYVLGPKSLSRNSSSSGPKSSPQNAPGSPQNGNGGQN